MKACKTFALVAFATSCAHKEPGRQERSASWLPMHEAIVARACSSNTAANDKLEITLGESASSARDTVLKGLKSMGFDSAVRYWDRDTHRFVIDFQTPDCIGMVAAFEGAQQHGRWSLGLQAAQRSTVKLSRPNCARHPSVRPVLGGVPNSADENIDHLDRLGDR